MSIFFSREIILHAYVYVLFVGFLFRYCPDKQEILAMY